MPILTTVRGDNKTIKELFNLVKDDYSATITNRGTELCIGANLGKFFNQISSSRCYCRSPWQPCSCRNILVYTQGVRIVNRNK